MAQNLKGVIPDKAVQVIQLLSDSVSTLATRFNTLASKPLVTKTEADANYGPSTMVRALQVSGSNPLNITGLIGQVSQNQLAQIPSFTTIPTSGKYSQPGTLISLNGVLTVVTAPGQGSSAGADAKTVNGATVPASASVLGSNSGRQLVSQSSVTLAKATVTNLAITPVAIAALPASPSTGELAAVNDALAPAAGTPVAPGGAANALVWWNGAQWTVFGI